MMEPWVENPRREVEPRRTEQPLPVVDRICISVNWNWKKVVAAAIVGMCIFSLLGESSFISRNILNPLMSYFEGEQVTMSSFGSLLSRPNPEVTRRTFVVTTTFYPDISDIRFDIAMEMCRLAKVHEMHLIIVDDSPEHETVRGRFQEVGTGYVHVYKQNKGRWPGKGGALKQSIRHAADLIQKENDERGNGLNDAVICFTEPEKVDLMNHMTLVSKPVLDGEADVVVPTRNDALFRATYPIEQYHSESFGNLHFDLLAKQFEGFQREVAQRLDWLFGPFAFKASLAGHWMDYEGTSWDAQIIPYVRGVRRFGWRIMSVTVNFRHPKEMKEQEEGYPEWTKKRLTQLNLLFDLLGDKEMTR